MPMCFRCLNTNPLINPKGDKCNTCSNVFIRSLISFEILPLIEFRPSKALSDDEAIEMIKSSSLAKVTKPGFLEYKLKISKINKNLSFYDYLNHPY